MRELAYERRLREWVERQGMIAERLSYPRSAAGGETLAYRFAPLHAPRALVLIVHGAGNDALFAFPGFFKELLLRGFEVFSFDLDGHGRASTTHLSPGAVASAIPAALEQARAGRADLPTHAVGLSLGGSILLHALPALGDTVSSAVLVSAPLRVRFGLRAVLGELGPSLAVAAFRQREHVGAWGLIPSFGPVKRGSYPLRLAEPGRGAFGYVEVLNNTLDRLSLEDAARRVQTPTLLVYGTSDRLVPAEQGGRLARLIPRSKLQIVPRGTHLTTFFARPVAERIPVWLEERTE